MPSATRRVRKQKEPKRYCTLNKTTKRCRKTSNAGEKSDRCYLSYVSDRCSKYPKEMNDTVVLDGFVLTKKTERYVRRILLDKTDQQMEKIREKLNNNDMYSRWVNRFATNEALKLELYQEMFHLARHGARDTYKSEIIMLKMLKLAINNDPMLASVFAKK